MATPDRTCPGCGGSVAAESRFCPSCGASVERLAPGQILDGRYEILDKIAEGGMGQVYRARHLHLDEIRIIKVTRPDMPGEGPEPRRFQEEARMATLVRHPNVAALYDFARQPDGSYYMVWEFIDGITLQEWLHRHGPLPLHRTLDVAAQVLAGLREIHRQGIVHRDISPDNIMLRELPDGSLQVKIIDLGIAKRVTAATQMTTTGMFVGKLKYASPEQAGSLPAGQAIDGRSDLYSFGVVLYETLTGKAPFEAKTPLEYLGKHLREVPPPLDTSRLPRNVGEAMRAVVRKALEKDRERRFRDAGEFSDALARLTPAVEPPEPAPGTGSRTIAPTSTFIEGPRRERSAWIGAALAIVVAVGGGVWALAHYHGSGPESVPPSTAAPPAQATEKTAPTEAPTLSTAAIPSPPAASAAGNTPAVTRSHTAPHGKTPAPLPGTSPVPPTANEIGATPAGPTSAPGNAAARRERLALWKSRTMEDRARRARELARWANGVVAKHPDAPDVQQLKIDLPALFKQEALNALDQNRPFFARLFHQAYLSLDFAPADADLARRIDAVPVPRRTPG